VSILIVFGLELFIISLNLHHELESICRGEKSIFGALEKNGVTNPEQYIGFYSLRTYDKINPQAVKKGLGILKDEMESNSINGSQAPVDSGIYVTEELYIHSKLLIADDRIVICGSGELNFLSNQKLNIYIDYLIIILL
jgi:phospholipase D1/2